MFVGRAKELAKLETMYNSAEFEMAIVYGRRRVGKTTLIQEFCKGKNAIYSVGRETNREGNLACISQDIYHLTNPASEGTSTFTDWEKVFTYLENISREQRLILVLDEYPYFAKTCPEISSILQAHIDQFMKTGKLFIILCGSSMSFMENQVLGYQSPLYGRRTAQFKIHPFTFWETRAMLPGFKPEEQAVLYGATGGIPEYLAGVDNSTSLEKNLIELFFSDDGIMFEEPENLLKQELREPATYNSIIKAIADGATRLSEIANKTHLESNKCGKYLNTLIALGIVAKELPVTDEDAKRGIYYLADQMFRFWYSFVPDNASRIISRDGEQVYAKVVEPHLADFMGLTFERICMEYLELLSRHQKSPFFLQKIGRWWGNNPSLKRQEEIDLVATFGKEMLLGECKWRKEKTDVELLVDLERKSELFPHFHQKHFWVFSKSGFSVQAQEYVNGKTEWKLLTFKEMCDQAETLTV